MGERDTRIVEVAGSNPVASTTTPDRNGTQGGAGEGGCDDPSSVYPEASHRKGTQAGALKSEGIRQGAAKDLARVAEAWPRLSPEMRRAILALVSLPKS